MAYILEELTKLSTESILFDMNFEKRMSTGETIAAISLTDFTNLGRISGSSDIVLDTTVFSGSTAQLRISGGTSNEQYEVTITVLTNLGNTKVGQGLLRIE